MAKGEHPTIDSDLIQITIVNKSNSSESIEFDVAGEFPFKPSGAAPDTNEYLSQKYKEMQLKVKPFYETISFPVTFADAEYTQVDTWRRNLTTCVYTASGTGITTFTHDCVVRVSDPPKGTPGQKGKTPMTLEVVFIGSEGTDT